MDEIETKFKLVTASGIAKVGYNQDLMMGSELQEYYVAYGDDAPKTYNIDLKLGQDIPVRIFQSLIDSNIYIVNGVIVPDHMLFNFNKFVGSLSKDYGVHRMNE